MYSHVSWFVLLPVCYVYHQHHHLDLPPPPLDMVSCITSPLTLELEPGLATKAVLLPFLWMTTDTCQSNIATTEMPLFVG